MDEADRVLGVNFEAELRVIFQCLPKKRQTLLFSATMSSNLQTLLELSANKAYFYAAYEGFKTVESLKQQYIFIPKNVKDVYLLHILNKMEEMGVRSAMIFVSTCRFGFLNILNFFFISNFRFFCKFTNDISTCKLNGTMCGSLMYCKFDIKQLLSKIASSKPFDL